MPISVHQISKPDDSFDLGLCRNTSKISGLTVRRTCPKQHKIQQALGFLFTPPSHIWHNQWGGRFADILMEVTYQSVIFIMTLVFILASTSNRSVSANPTAPIPFVSGSSIGSTIRCLNIRLPIYVFALLHRSTLFKRSSSRVKISYWTYRTRLNTFS